MNITHYDLFAGIGGFSIALEEIFYESTIRHIFCEWESFPTAVLRQHWPDGEFYGDIAELVADTEGEGLQQSRETRSETIKGSARRGGPTNDFTIVTGGFPCQPFSAAGRRKGTADDRYQWPNMFEVIRNTQPDWVIAENVRGLVTWNEGLVLETVCADLESEDYEVQPLIIPAVAVGAPHRRDRVWIIAHTKDYDGRRELRNLSGKDATITRPKEQYENKTGQPSDAGRDVAEESHRHQNAQNPLSQRVERRRESTRQILGGESAKVQDTRPSWPDWSRNWQEVAFATCDDTVDDGLSKRLVRLPDGTTITRPAHRKHSLKAYGNGIVPEVAMNIMKAIKETL